MDSTRLSRSGCPWGSRLRWVTLAAVNSIEEPLGQAATQAPQAMQAAASKAASASALGTGVAWASGAEPVLAEMYPPAWLIRPKAERSTTSTLMTGNGTEGSGPTGTVAQ